MADTLMHGNLATRLRELRDEHRSFDDISRVLYAEQHVVVSSRTLRDWCDQLGLDDDPEPGDPTPGSEEAAS
jgi:hypothetical protein